VATIFPGLSRTKAIFQDFPGPEILKNKNPRLSRRRGNPEYGKMGFSSFFPAERHGTTCHAMSYLQHRGWLSVSSSWHISSTIHILTSPRDTLNTDTDQEIIYSLGHVKNIYANDLYTADCVHITNNTCYKHNKTASVARQVIASLVLLAGFFENIQSTGKIWLIAVQWKFLYLKVREAVSVKLTKWLPCSFKNKWSENVRMFVFFCNLKVHKVHV